MKTKIYDGMWYGNKVSDYGLESGFIDYATLSKSGDAVLCNGITSVDEYLIENIINGTDYDEENDTFAEVYQWYIIDTALKETLCHWTDELVYYSNVLDVYVWGVTHYGTAWSHVLTDIEIEQ